MFSCLQEKKICGCSNQNIFMFLLSFKSSKIKQYELDISIQLRPRTFQIQQLKLIAGGSNRHKLLISIIKE